MSKDRNHVSKTRKLEEVFQRLYDAEAKGDAFQIKIWKAIIAKLESQESPKPLGRKPLKHIK